MGYTHASILKRMFAFLIDQFIYFISLLPLSIMLALFVPGDFSATLIILLTMCALEVLQLNLFKGRTLGKMILKLRIIDLNTGTVPSNQAFMKRMLLIRPVMELIGMIMSLLTIVYACYSMSGVDRDEKGQALWDKFAGTTVIDESGR